jgi:hypothetical protein
MASWKKVLVSGSAGEFSTVTASIGLTVGTNQVIGTTQAGTRLTGSFTGSFTGDGSGLTGVSADFPGTPVSSLDPLDKFFIQDSADSVSKYITYNDFLGDIAGTNLVVDPASPNSTTLKLSDNISVTTVTAAGGADTIGFIGNITGSDVIGTVTSASYALSSSYSLTASFALNAGGGTLNISASAIGGAGGGNTSIDLGTEALIISGTANQITVTANNANNLLTIGLPNNVTIPGNLNVVGTTTTVSASSLLVTDKFIVLSSGSTTKNDGGIIIQSSTSPAATGSGFGFMLDGSPDAPRWGVTSSLSPTANNATTPDEYMVTAKTVITPQTAGSTAPTYGGATATGNGNMVIDSNGDIWIYVF